jgi:hypothetical protein
MALSRVAQGKEYSMTADSTVYLRWRAGRPAPEEERFGGLDAALDAVEARWPELQHQVPQVLDARRILLLSTAELAAMVAEEQGGDEAGSAG